MNSNSQPAPLRFHERLRHYASLARVDHWIKNVFILPGILAKASVHPFSFNTETIISLCAGTLSVCLIASSNYVINEIQDAPTDRFHPEKRNRPLAAGLLDMRIAYAEWIALMLGALALAAVVSVPFLITMVAFWLMGCVYNIPPVRSKDMAYMDVLSESVNNPIRLLAGWLMVGPAGVPPASLLLSYWMVGAYFMAVKRFAEYRGIDDASRAAKYRRSFAVYTESSLLVSIMFYSAVSMLFFGAFVMRYRIEMILSFPMVALVMARYLSLSFKKDSAAQAPERLYRERGLLFTVVGCAVLMGILFLVDIPWLANLFPRTWNLG